MHRHFLNRIPTQCRMVDMLRQALSVRFPGYIDPRIDIMEHCRHHVTAVCVNGSVQRQPFHGIGYGGVSGYMSIVAPQKVFHTFRYNGETFHLSIDWSASVCDPAFVDPSPIYNVLDSDMKIVCSEQMLREVIGTTKLAGVWKPAAIARHLTLKGWLNNNRLRRLY